MVRVKYSNLPFKYALRTQPKIEYTTVSAYLRSTSINEKFAFSTQVFWLTSAYSRGRLQYCSITSIAALSKYVSHFAGDFFFSSNGFITKL